MECDYGQGLDCECEATGWDCGRQVCPATQPAGGETCTGGDGACPYGGTTCDCTQDTDTWSCWNPSDCPTAQPADDSACPTAGMLCELPNGDCECEATGWQCSGQFCPEAAPAAGSACQGGSGVCTYGAQTCDCDSSLWVCWNPADCPATQPAEGGGADGGASACTVIGMTCDYAGTECECEDDGWDCNTGGP
jgi:hypothetical protein